MTNCSNEEDGFVLVSVIWMAGLLAVVATAFAITVRSHTLSGSNIIYNTRAEYVADGMTVFTALQLANPANAGAYPKVNGEAAFCVWPGETAVAISVQDQGGLVDLNTASPELMGTLLRKLGTDDGMSAGIIAALQDFRDPDQVSTDGGPEPVAYPGKPYGPKNAPFAIAGEIDQIPQISDGLLGELLPLVTVYSQQSGIDLSVAPQHILQLLSNGNSADAELAGFASPTSAKTFSIDVTAELKNGARYRRVAIISILQQPDRPFATLEWMRGGDAGDAEPLPRSGPPCVN